MSTAFDMHSPEIGAIMEALSKAQAAMAGAREDSENPYFKSSYADLTSVWNACRKPLAENSLGVTQIVQVLNGDRHLVSILGHPSGQWIKSIMPIKVAKDDAHGLGSALTYCRRYSLAALVGVCPADDDGNEATGKPKLEDDEPPLALEIKIPDYIRNDQVEKFILECAKATNKTRNQMVMAANSYPEDFVKRLVQKIQK